jgi:hypothetical protein
MIGYDIYDRFTMGAFSIVSKPDFDDQFFCSRQYVQEFFTFYIKFSNNTGCPKIRGTT